MSDLEIVGGGEDGKTKDRANVSIVSDGDSLTTQVLVEGEPIEEVKGVELSISSQPNAFQAVVVLNKADVDIRETNNVVFMSKDGTTYELVKR